MTSAQRTEFYLKHRIYRGQRVARMAEIFGTKALEELFSIAIKTPPVPLPDHQIQSTEQLTNTAHV